MRYLWLIPLLLLVGCADSGTRGDNTERVYKAPVEVINSGAGTVTLTINLNASGETKTDTDQDTQNSSAISPRTSAGWNGGTAALAESGAEFMMEGIESIYEAWQDNRKTDADTSSNPDNDNTVTPETPDDVTEETDDVADSTEYQTKFSHTSMRTSVTKNTKALVLCPGQTIEFDSCTASGVEIPRHSTDDKGRETYLHTTQALEGDITCIKDGKTYLYKSDSVENFGEC